MSLSPESIVKLREVLTAAPDSMLVPITMMRDVLAQLEAAASRVAALEEALRELLQVYMETYPDWLHDDPEIVHARKALGIEFPDDAAARAMEGKP